MQARARSIFHASAPIARLDQDGWRAHLWNAARPPRVQQVRASCLLRQPASSSSEPRAGRWFRSSDTRSGKSPNVFARKIDSAAVDNALSQAARGPLPRAGVIPVRCSQRGPFSKVAQSCVDALTVVQNAELWRWYRGRGPPPSASTTCRVPSTSQLCDRCNADVDTPAELAVRTTSSPRAP
eukprot:scaffold264445_cov28-Tisochrysis_lutea.AAC.2